MGGEGGDGADDRQKKRKKKENSVANRVMRTIKMGLRVIYIFFSFLLALSLLA